MHYLFYARFYHSFQAFDQHLNMVLGNAEETVKSIEVDEETDEEIVKVCFPFTHLRRIHAVDGSIYVHMCASGVRTTCKTVLVRYQPCISLDHFITILARRPPAPPRRPDKQTECTDALRSRRRRHSYLPPLTNVLIGVKSTAMRDKYIF